MKTSTIVWIVIAVLILGGCAWYYVNTKNGSTAYSNTGSNAPMQAASSTNDGSASGGPSVNMGVRGSVNQGNYGGAQQ